MADRLTEKYLRKLLDQAATTVEAADPQMAERMRKAAAGRYPPQCAFCHEYDESCAAEAHTGLVRCKACREDHPLDGPADGGEYPTPDTVEAIPLARLGTAIPETHPAHAPAAELALAEGRHLSEPGRCAWGSLAWIGKRQARAWTLPEEAAAVVLWNDGEYWAPPIMPARSVRILDRAEATAVLDNTTSVTLRAIWALHYNVDGTPRTDVPREGILTAAARAADVYERRRFPHRLKKAASADG